MGRSRYRITEPDKPHFLTSTVLEWMPVFTRPETVQILLDSWSHLREHHGLRLYGFVILENHCHWAARAPQLDKCVAKFHSYTARCIIDLLREAGVRFLLKRFAFAKRAHKRDRRYQFWQEGCHSELIWSEEVMRQKLDYIHYNPVKRGYVAEPEQWRYSSAANYSGQEGLMEIEPWH
jgi:REP element-mobilizing transposase RayT